MSENFFRQADTAALTHFEKMRRVEALRREFPSAITIVHDSILLDGEDEHAGEVAKRLADIFSPWAESGGESR